MSQSFIPSRDASYDQWLESFTEFCIASGASYGLTPEQIAELQTVNSSWHGAYEQHLDNRQQSEAMTQSKIQNRRNSESLARQLARIMQANPNMSDPARAAAGLTVPDSKPTLQTLTILEDTPPPLLLLDWSERTRILVKFGPNPGNSRLNGLPEGIRGGKVFHCIGGIPPDVYGWRHLADVTRSPFVHHMVINEPTTIAYRVQYFDHKMRTGIFSAPAQAIMSP